MKTYNFFKTIYKTLNILVILMMTLNAPLSVFAYTDTDKDDYQPGELVTIFGDNSDGLFYQEGVVVDVVVTGPTPDDHYYCTSEPASAEGSWSCTVTISEDPLIAVGYYSYVTMQNGVVIEEGSFTDAAPPSIEQLWQCDPPTPYDRPTYDCTPGSAVGWVTGNNDGLYYEGDTVPYRTRLSNLKQGDEYSITIEWDTTQSSKHAIDYLKTYNATMENAKPCVGLTKLPAGFDCFTASTWEIPADTFMQSDPDWIANGGFQDPGEFSMFGGTITSVSEYTSPADYLGNTKTSITVFFTAGSTDLVMAWGGHIAERADWGLNNSAVSISGSPYHMRIISWYDVTNNKSLNVGQMDRSLSAEAVVYPGKIIIVKSASPSSETSFPFTAAPSPLYNFSLVDDMDSTDPSWDFLDIKEFKTYTVTENTPYGWALDSIFCSTDSPNGGSTVVNLGTATATIDLKEGEYVTCTFVNTKNLNQDLTVTKTATPAFNRLYKWQIDKSVDDTRIEIAEGGTATFNYSVKVTPNGFVDSNWIVSGSISVTNPNDVDFTGVTITDAIPGGSCLVTDGTNVTVPAMGSVTKSYSCTLTSGGSGTNTATATWDPVVNYSVTGSAQGTAGFDFSSVTPSETNKVITVVDDKTNPGSPETLGTADWVDGEKTFNYSLDKMGVAGTCTDYTQCV
ncbi:MAG: hypothetical protein CVU41_05425 [Chloroflexi bacterium HGW-Chloroflexi-3]|nr:MAG: hypothetical protein CVU41_05425 [Chloroflexi bacterium HGW-Chloroflexi-3]